MPDTSHEHEAADAFKSLEGVLVRETARVRFGELFDFATSVFLKEAPVIPEAVPASGEAAVIQALGARGLKSAVELDRGSVTEAPLSGEGDHSTVMRIGTPARLPSYFSESVDPEIVASAEAFGEAIIAESFDVLGSDAPSHAYAFRDAQTVADQLRECQWLEKRILAIQAKVPDPDEAEQDDDYHIYHPVRLIPKMIGNYPDINLNPTCLGVSLLSAAFFDKAGTDTLHAGIIESANEGVSNHALPAFMALIDCIDRLAPDMHDSAIRQSILKLAQSVNDYTTREDAPHAAVYARLLDGSWYQSDPNYRATTVITDESFNTQLTTAHDLLESMAVTAPNLQIGERSRQYPARAIAAVATLSRVDGQDYAAYRSMVASRMDSVMDGPDESFYQTVYATVVKPFFDDVRAHGDAHLFDVAFGNPDDDSSVTVLNAAFSLTFDKYVAWRDSTADFHRHWEKESYRQRRLDDLAILPFLMMAEIIRADGMAESLTRDHARIEMGRTAMRVGLSVLSDIDSTMDHGLPASFWLSVWPGSIPVAEFIDRFDRAGSLEKGIIANNVVHHGMNSLTSEKNHARIDSFIRPFFEEK